MKTSNITEEPASLLRSSMGNNDATASLKEVNNRLRDQLFDKTEALLDLKEKS